MTVTRALVEGDRPVLVTATLGNLNWVGERFTVNDVVSRPEFAHYVDVDLARGDFGVVAQEGDRAIGVAWAVFLPDVDPGYGFVAPDVPEVSLWVDAACRGRGVGRHLLRELQAESARRGLRAVSLSVEEGNRARDLYQAEGFVPVTGREADGVMLWSSAGG